MTVAREPSAEGAARDPMINRADEAEPKGAARDPRINRADEADRGVRGRILYGMVRLQDLDGTKIMKVILHMVGPG